MQRGGQERRLSEKNEAGNAGLVCGRFNRARGASGVTSSSAWD
ncbi:hypothetical protein [Lysobacter gummosus]